MGLGGLSKKVTKIFKNIRKRVDRQITKILQAAKRKARGLFRSGKVKAKSKKEKSIEKTDEIKLKRKFSIAGSGHTLTSLYKNGSVSVKMASTNPGNLVVKVKDEIKEHEKIALATSDSVTKEKHETIAKDLKEIISTHDEDVSKIKSLKDFDKIRKGIMKLSDDLIKKIVKVGNKHGLKDFVYNALDILPSLSEIEKIIKMNFEKHTHLHGTRGPHAIGDGYNNTAMAAENYLGWMHDTGRKHTVKSMDSLAFLQTELKKLDSIDAKVDGQSGITHEEWYKRGKQTEKDTQKSISSPKAYLTDKGQLQIYLDDIRRQRSEGKNVGYTNIVKKYRL